MTDYAVPAFSIEAERAVVGGLILDPDQTDDVLAVLTPDQMFNPSHRLICGAVASIQAAGRDFNIIVLAEHLEKENALEEAGGLEYLMELSSSISSAANLPAYAKIVKDKFLERSLVEHCRKTIESLANPDGVYIDEIVSESLAGIEAIEQGLEAEKDFNLNEELKKAVKDIEISFEGKQVVGVRPCFDELAEKTKDLLPGQLITVAGLPGSGKTTLAVNLIESNAAKDKRPHVIFSAEMTTTEILQKMLSSLSGVEHGRFDSGDLSEEHWPMLISAVERMKGMNLYVYDKEQPTISFIRSKLAKIQKTHDEIAMVMVDYLQIMKAETGKGRTEEIESLTGGLKGIAKKYRTPVIMLSQLIKDKDKRNQVPNNSLLKGSGSIEADSDKVLFTHTPVSSDGELETRVREIHVTKNRKGQMGVVKMGFNGRKSRFEKLSAESFGYDM